MESISVAIIALVIIFLFKSSIKKINKHVEEELTVTILENKSDLYERAQDAYDDLVTTVGEDFSTPEEIYRKMIKKNKKNTNQNKS